MTVMGTKGVCVAHCPHMGREAQNGQEERKGIGEWFCVEVDRPGTDGCIPASVHTKERKLGKGRWGLC